MSKEGHAARRAIRHAAKRVYVGGYRLGSGRALRRLEPEALCDIEGLDSALLRHILAKLLAAEPTAVAVLVTGSYARSEACAGSDLDLTVLTLRWPEVCGQIWFEELDGSQLLPVSVTAQPLRRWLSLAEQPSRWPSLGFPSTEAAILVWATRRARRRLRGDPSLRMPPAGPDLATDLAELVLCASKVARLRAKGDSIGMRVFAREAGMLAPALIVH